ncbi:MAG: type II toxin-antitoxin system HicB family antitoxin [Tabrizicola sp.]|jgi:predicted HicB family RNase H-like nuclease|uniref:type II toxin-antitoxin system HicB family antitoxin n=1 Tax=Tabrizicola sp. TaxID=2005166 RepID=UPI003BB1AFC1
MKPYKGYGATVSFDEDALLFHGDVLGIRDVITFQARTAEELPKAFHGSVDAYLAFCAETGRKPEKPYSGRLAFRTTPEHHRLMADAAARRAKSLNQWMDEVLADAARETLGDSCRSLNLR